MRFVVALLSFLLVPSAQKSHCKPPCYTNPRPACEAAWEPGVDAIFLGTITNVNQENGAETLKLTATVKVEERFLGTDGDTVSVFSGGDSCGGFPFSKGNRYLFYAKSQSHSGTFSVALCGGTKPVSEASDDLNYLRGIAAAPKSATVLGTVYRYGHPPNPNDKLLRLMGPFVGGKVIIKSNAHSYEVYVTQDGKFRAESIEPGEYTISVQTDQPVLAESSTGFTWLDTSHGGVVRSVHSGGCVLVDFKIDPFHRAGGRVASP